MFVTGSDLIFGVLSAIELDDETCLQTGEIGNIGAERHLPPEVAAVDWYVLQGAPKSLFRIGCIPTQSARSGRADFAG